MSPSSVSVFPLLSFHRCCLSGYVTGRYHSSSSVTQKQYYLYKITNNLLDIVATSYLTPWSHPTTRSHTLLVGLLGFAQDMCSIIIPTNIALILAFKKSTYKFKRAFFRHDRRTAPKFGTHVRIETRLALTKNKLTNPTPEGFRGLFIASSVVPFVRPFAPVVCVR